MSDPLTDLSPTDRARLEAVLVEFDLHWNADRLAAAAARLPPAGPFRGAALREMVKIDLERRGRRGLAVSLRDYLARFPELADTPTVPADLAAAEAAARDTLARAGATGSVHLPERFGRFRVLRPLGRGGMGGVYLAHDTELDRQVALKVPRFPPDDAAAVERFTREAKAAATIDHPSVCRVYDVGRIDGLPYISMAYIEGPTLADALRAGPVPARRAAEVARDVARALAEAHRRGVVHRDLKPANILLQRDEGRGMRDERKTGSSSSLIPHPSSLIPVVTDFGLAARTAPDDPRLTAEGVVAGTPPYMSPEQVAGERAGPASDVYSLGAVLYEMLTGRPPFTGSRVEIFTQVLSADPPAADRPGTDPRLDAIARRALAKKPADRFPDMAAFADALDGWLAGAGGGRRPGRGRAAVRAGLAAGAALVVLIPAALLVRNWGGAGPAATPPSGGATTVAVAPPAVTATPTPAASATTGTAPPPATSRGMLKYQSIPGLQRPKAAAEASLPAGDRRIVAIAFSPDGREVYAAVREGAHLVVRRWDAGTGAEEPGGPKPAPFEWAAFAPDGARYLAGGGAPAAELRRSESGDLVRAFDTEPRATAGGLSRDGRRVIVGLAAGAAGYRARVYDADTGKAVGEYAGHGAEVRCVALSDDGKLAYSASPDRQAVWAVDTGRPAHEAGENGVTCAAFLPRAAVVVFAYRTGVISRIDLRESIQFGGFDDRHKGGVTCLAAAPDGGLVVSGGADKSVHGWEPWHRWQRWELTGLAGPVTAAAVAPDGRRFVTATERAWTVWDLPKSK